MTPLFEHDYIQSYERGIASLNDDPNNRELQHQVVLSLARAGALDFAISEYERYGLTKIIDHEDIMALGGRLSKDLYLKSNGAVALEHAKDAAQLYGAAFQSTKGYYSGINAATMALMAGMPNESVSTRVQSILKILPPAEKLTPIDHYFIEATRAECFLLDGDLPKTKIWLKKAIAFDPLNYAAHASTIKQFKMILSGRGESLDWLSVFKPPRSVHYAGHIKLTSSATKYDAIALSVADEIQKNDVGFGFGALAAGSDIIIAEALLAEGAELHVVLPCERDVFLEHSVQPFGADWIPRYRACLEQAASIKIVAKDALWPNAQINRMTGQFTMGQAVLYGQYLGVDPAQFLIWNEQKQASYTAIHAADWKRTRREQIIVPITSIENGAAIPIEVPNAFPFIMKCSNKGGISYYDTVAEATKAALEVRKKSPAARVALHVDIPNGSSETVLTKILEGSAPQSILMSETFASLLAYVEDTRFEMNFSGLIDCGEETPLRCYAVNA